MIDKVELILNNISWEKRTAGDFLGRYLSEPKPDVIFEPLSEGSRQAFTKDIAIRPIELDLKSIMLFQHGHFYINGEPLAVPVNLVACMRLLADKRYLDGASLNKTQQIALADTLYPCYEAGYIHFT